MQVRFLLGPARSGKTRRCIDEIIAELLRAPEGRPLLLLAPKQATYQLERQLLQDGRLPGFCRLQILSFERLVIEILHQNGISPGVAIDEEGRVMILRALLHRHRHELEVFRASARMTGLARHLSGLLRELDQANAPASTLRKLAARTADPSLAAKLRDAAFLSERYSEWLRAGELGDSSARVEKAVSLLKTGVGPVHLFDAVWLDGFAQLTPQERGILSALAPRTGSMTLAFCLDPDAGVPLPWHSLWAPTREAYEKVRSVLAGQPGIEVEEVPLHRPAAEAGPTRATRTSPALAHLERHWAHPRAFEGVAAPAVQITVCATPEVEAIHAARVVRAFVRESGCRYRDTAVLVRSLESYADVMARVFRRYDIPCFIDRRESIAHHPAAELLRSALRLAAFDWQPVDWFAALRTGLAACGPERVDTWENLALKHGWSSAVWRGDSPPTGLGEGAAVEFEAQRALVAGPFLVLTAQLRGATPGPTGPELAGAIRALWDAVGASRELEAWSELDADSALPGQSRSIHTGVEEEIAGLVENLAAAFAHETLTLPDWCAILDSGLAGLTVGAVPPSLDQVLIGSIDRSRNPELRLAVVPGLNEAVFPALPKPGPILSEPERSALASEGLELGTDLRQQTALERYFAYIALTRPEQRLVVSYCLAGATGQALQPSPILQRLHQLFPGLAELTFDPAVEPEMALHPVELARPLLARGANQTLPPIDLLTPAPLVHLIRLLERYRDFCRSRATTHLAPDVATTLMGGRLDASPPQLEMFAQCPFRHFASHTLRGREREEWTTDRRDDGSFRHALLKGFHEKVRDLGLQWRDIDPADAAAWIREIGERLAAEYRAGIWFATPRARFHSTGLVEATAGMISTLVAWARTYDFNPSTVEAAFGDANGEIAPVEFPLGDGRSLFLRGRIDRVDLRFPPGTTAGHVVVVDYKLGSRAVDPPLLQSGIQIQLPAYLLAVLRAPELAGVAKETPLVPAGFFYIALQGQDKSAASRASSDPGPAENPHRHRGRFDVTHVGWFDSGQETKSCQFNFSRTKDGTVSKRTADPMAPEGFEALMAAVERTMTAHAIRILDGEMGPSPFRKGQTTACDHCEWLGACRFDRWTDPFRDLKPADPAPAPAGGPQP